MSLTSIMLRLVFGYSDHKRDKGLSTPEDMHRVNDISYGPDKEQVLDVYRPKGEEGKLPVIVSVHGGGWVYGNKERYQYYCMDLARRGFAVVNFSYRLAPHHKFPASLADACSVFSWVLSHAEEHGFDTENIFAVGDSAGAHLLSLFCCLCTNPSYAREFSFSAPEGFCPKAIALNCGAYAVNPNGGGQTGRLMKDLIAKERWEKDCKLINVLPFISEGFPPVFYMTCSGDFLEEEAGKLGKRLMEQGITHEYHYYGDKDHKLGHVFHLNIRLAGAQRCNDEECAFFSEKTPAEKSK